MVACARCQGRHFLGGLILPLLDERDNLGLLGCDAFFFEWNRYLGLGRYRLLDLRRFSTLTRRLIDGHRLGYRAVGDNRLLVSGTPDAWVYFNREALAGSPRSDGVYRR